MLNRVSLVGRLTKDVEVRYATDGQTAIAKFTLAVDRTFKKDGQPSADFLPIIVFGKSAENCGKYIGKGRLVGVSGRIQTRSWDDTEGKKHYATEVIADEVDFLDKPSEASTGTQNNNSANNSDNSNDDELPF
jgi:single-strand DNA-binding protein